VISPNFHSSYTKHLQIAQNGTLSATVIQPQFAVNSPEISTFAATEFTTYSTALTYGQMFLIETKLGSDQQVPFKTFVARLRVCVASAKVKGVHKRVNDRESIREGHVNAGERH
jgi:hypothetical protein